MAQTYRYLHLSGLAGIGSIVVVHNHSLFERNLGKGVGIPGISEFQSGFTR
ncbi:MAG: hypothetical protein GY744_09525 [Gammaproteobacteria bacterium]|nr:hypothetical protein [Gammaproteobacteria bacterium]